jgi:hypothetical protein
VGKSTPHPGKKKSCKEYTPLQDIIIQNIIIRKKNETKTAQAGFSHPSRQKNPLIWGITRHPNKQNKTNRPGRVKAPP